MKEALIRNSSLKLLDLSYNGFEDEESLTILNEGRFKSTSLVRYVTSRIYARYVLLRRVERLARRERREEL
jgi:hypothetical protein